MRILGIIPARGGSKGIPSKNIIDLCGRPLISWSIKTGIELVKNKTISKCIVSTDDTKIAKIAIQCGAEVPFLRPIEAAKDSSKSIEYVIHALDELKKDREIFDAVMILQPTSPQRNSDEIKLVVTDFVNSDSDSLISCYKEDYINELVMYTKCKKSLLKPFNKYHNKGIRRQTHGSVFIRNGALYITKVPFLLTTKELICDNPMLFEMSKTNSINIDNLEDLRLLRMILCR